MAFCGHSPSYISGLQARRACKVRGYCRELRQPRALMFREVIPGLKKIAKPGGVYLGVGPEQNLTYIGALRPHVYPLHCRPGIGDCVHVGFR